jgi:hypothetical protein
MSFWFCNYRISSTSLRADLANFKKLLCGLNSYLNPSTRTRFLISVLKGHFCRFFVTVLNNLSAMRFTGCLQLPSTAPLSHAQKPTDLPWHTNPIARKDFFGIFDYRVFPKNFRLLKISALHIYISVCLCVLFCLLGISRINLLKSRAGHELELAIGLFCSDRTCSKQAGWHTSAFLVLSVIDDDFRTNLLG